MISTCQTHGQCFKCAGRDALKTNQGKDFDVCVEKAKAGNLVPLQKWIIGLQAENPVGKRGSKRAPYEHSERVHNLAKGFEASTHKNRRKMIYEEYIDYYQNLTGPKKLSEEQATQQWAREMSDPGMARFRSKVAFFSGEEDHFKLNFMALFNCRELMFQWVYVCIRSDVQMYMYP